MDDAELETRAYQTTITVHEEEPLKHKIGFDLSSKEDPRQLTFWSYWMEGDVKYV